MAQVVSVRDSVPVMPGASDAFRTAREDLFGAEAALLDQIRAVAAKRRDLPAGPEVADYAFSEGGRRVRLFELFSKGSELIVYHLMYWAADDEFCPMCSMWIDGLNGVAKHIEQRANLVVATRAPVEKLQAWAKRRGWDTIRLLSDDGPAFARDIGAEDANGDPIETVAVFERDGAAIRNTYLAHAFVREQWGYIDLLSPVWHAFDLLRSGRDDWHPSNEYM